MTSNYYLRKATERKEAKDLNGAIKCLRIAYRLAANEVGRYSVKEFLRLPLYLQAAGRDDEALIEFNKLLTTGYPGQIRSQEMLPMDEAYIFDKIRLFWQRKRNFILAEKFRCFAYASEAIAFYYQRRNDDLKYHLAQYFRVGTFEPDELNDDELTPAELELKETMRQHLRGLPHINLAELERDIEPLLFKIHELK